MKRLIVLTVFFGLLSITGMAQNSGTYTAKKTTTKTVKTYKYTPRFEKGWNLRPEVGVSIPEPKLEFLFSAGYQINPYIFLGLGAGVSSFQRYYTDKFWYSTSFPLFATGRVNFLTTKHGFTPFFDTKMGYAFGLWGDYDYWSYHIRERPQGFYGHWGIGFNWHNFDLLLSAHIIGSEYEYYDNNGNIYSDNNNDIYFSLSLAYNIPIKRNK